MANIRADVPYTIKDGSEVGFRSPVDCSQITGLVVYYTAEDGTTASQEFLLTDAHGQDVGNIDHLFAEDVIVKVILDCTHGKAYVQNADTNDYIEKTFVKTVNGLGPDENGNVEVEGNGGGDPAGTAENAVKGHNQSRTAHEDIRLEIQAIRDSLAAFLDTDEETLNQLSELIAAIIANKTSVEALTNGKISVTDIVDNLTTNLSNRPLSAAQGVALKKLIDGLAAGKLDATALTAAINTALAQARDSREFDGKDGRGIKSIARTSGTGAAGTVDTYTITYTDDTTGTYQVRNGANGRDGEDGISPNIGANGNWYIGNTDTGVKAAQRGDDGLTPHVGDNGNWWIGDEDLGVSASGTDGQRGTGILYVTTTPSAYTTSIGGQTPTKRMSLSTIKSEAGVDEVLVGDLIQHSYYLYPIYYIEGSYAYTKGGRSIRGSAGAGGKTTITEVESLPYGSAPTITEAEDSTNTDRKYILGIPAGAPGAAYELTDKDMAEIAGMVVDNADTLAVITNQVLAVLPTWNGGAY